MRMRDGVPVLTRREGRVCDVFDALVADGEPINRVGRFVAETMGPLDPGFVAWLADGLEAL